VIKAIKKVDGFDEILAEIGQIVTFTVQLQNTGSSTAYDSLFMDPLQEGLRLLPETLTVNGVSIPNPNLTTGIPIGDSVPFDVPVEVAFQAKVTCHPLVGDLYKNGAIVDYAFIPCQEELIPFARHRLEVGAVGLQARSNIVTLRLPSPIIPLVPFIPAVSPLPAPPFFQGDLEKNKFFNRTSYTLEASWGAPNDPGVIAYRIYYKGRLEAQIPVGGPLVYQTCLSSRRDAYNLFIVAVYAGNIESSPVRLVLTN